jgi:hypothetical protein
VAFGSDPNFELLNCALLPIGELQIGDIVFPVSSKDTVARAEIAEQSERIKNRTLASPVRAAKDTK